MTVTVAVTALPRQAALVPWSSFGSRFSVISAELIEERLLVSSRLVILFKCRNNMTRFEAPVRTIIVDWPTEKGQGIRLFSRLTHPHVRLAQSQTIFAYVCVCV